MSKKHNFNRNRGSEQAAEAANAEGAVAEKDAAAASEGSFVDVPNMEYDGGDFDLTGLDVAAEDLVGAFLSEEGDYAKLPHPDVFNAYPPEVQRKIMEWTDRDVRARRDDESRRRDQIMQAEVENSRRNQMFPTVITVIALLCAAVTAVVTMNPLFPLIFCLVPLAVITARLMGDGNSDGRRNKPPKV